MEDTERAIQIYEIDHDSDLEITTSTTPASNSAHQLATSVPARNYHPASAPHRLDDDDYFANHEDPFSSLAERSRSTPHTPDTRHDPIVEHPHRHKPGNISRRHSDSSGHFNRFAKNYLLPAAKWAYSPMGSKKNRRDKCQDYKIEYSVFKPSSHDAECASSGDPTGFQLQWDRILLSLSTWVEDDDLKPERIPKGSSGSYFIYGTDASALKRKVGVFKPKDEEPYGPLSPKWTKWLHRTFFPWFFGRSCLLPNIGYISEAAASILDRQLRTMLVPRTEVVHLTSRQFFYSYWNRHASSRQLPAKIGSFQYFLYNYTDADTWMKQFPLPSLANLADDSNVTIGANEQIRDNSFFWSKEVLLQFREELEKLVVLDYIMRNTDRGADNWMISIKWTAVSETETTKTLRPVLKIGAIDSGLAFPWKHPDEWRLFPFGWLFLPVSLIGQPFSDTTRKHFLPLLTSTKWWEDTVCKLKAVFQRDKNFKEKYWHKQLAVLKGQALNVVDVLRSPGEGPLELTRRNRLLVWDDEMRVPVHVSNAVMEHALESSLHDLVNTKKRPIGVIDEEADKAGTETTPLLLSAPLAEAANAERSIPGTTLESLWISGFDYNTNVGADDFEGNTKTVIIERIEPLSSKRPLFTYC